MPSYRSALKAAQKQLEAADVWPESAQTLLLEVCGLDGAALYRDYEEEMPQELHEKFLKGVERLKTGEPLGYILGYTWFYGRKIKVGPEVLIPRPETEELCANILAVVDEYFPEGELDVVDIGTGSGEIAATLALEEPRIRMCASDISADALKVARENAAALGAKIEFFEGDMLEPVKKTGKKFDILVSDPPYIPDEQKIDASVKDFEPHVALFGGPDGLKFYRALLSGAAEVLKEKAVLAFEIGYDQGDALWQLASEYFPDARAEILQDIEGKDRMLFIYKGIEDPEE